MIQDAIICDVCGKQKGQVNQWFVILPSGNGITRGITLYHWPAGHKAEEAKHLCGQNCVQKFIEQWMGA